MTRDRVRAATVTDSDRLSGHCGGSRCRDRALDATPPSLTDLERRRPLENPA